MSWDDVNEQLQEYAKFRNEQRTANAAEAIQRANAEYAKLPLCPYCGGRIQIGYELCQHCRNKLAWVGGHPCKPGQEGSLRQQLEANEKARLLSQKQAAVGCWQAFATLGGIVASISLAFIAIAISSAPMSQDAFFLTLITFVISVAVTLACSVQYWTELKELRSQTPEYQAEVARKKRIEDEKRWAKNRRQREEKEAKEASDSLFAKAENYLEQGNVLLACDCLKRIIDSFPNSEHAAKAKKMYTREKDADETQKRGKECYRKKEFKNAIELLHSVATNYPETQGGARAQKMLDLEEQANELYTEALKYSKLGNKAKMMPILMEIISKYPHTQFGHIAKNFIANQENSRAKVSSQSIEKPATAVKASCYSCNVAYRVVPKSENQIHRCPKCKLPLTLTGD